MVEGKNLYETDHKQAQITTHVSQNVKVLCPNYAPSHRETISRNSAPWLKCTFRSTKAAEFCQLKFLLLIRMPKLQRNSQDDSHVKKSYETKQYKKRLKAADVILKKFPDHGEWTKVLKGYCVLPTMTRNKETFLLSYEKFLSQCSEKNLSCSSRGNECGCLPVLARKVVMRALSSLPFKNYDEWWSLSDSRYAGTALFINKCFQPKTVSSLELAGLWETGALCAMKEVKFYQMI